MKLTAHGISLQLPRGWEGRILRRPGGDPLLHAGSFALPAQDGDFASGATEQMPAGAALLVLKEYRNGPALRAGHGLFAGTALPLPLTARRLSPRTLQVTRPGQRGMQHFFSREGRPFCLYVVVSDPAPARGPRTHAAAVAGMLSRCNAALQSLRIDAGTAG